MVKTRVSRPRLPLYSREPMPPDRDTRDKSRQTCPNCGSRLLSVLLIVRYSGSESWTCLGCPYVEDFVGYRDPSWLTPRERGVTLDWWKRAVEACYRSQDDQPDDPPAGACVCGRQATVTEVNDLGSLHYVVRCASAECPWFMTHRVRHVAIHRWNYGRGLWQRALSPTQAGP